MRGMHERKTGSVKIFEKNASCSIVNLCSAGDGLAEHSKCLFILWDVADFRCHRGKKTSIYGYAVHSLHNRVNRSIVFRHGFAFKPNAPGKQWKKLITPCE